jgi:hypothetical protein
VQNNDNEKQECLIISRQKETPDGLTTHVISSANFIMLIVVFLIQQHCDLNVRVAACSFFSDEAMDEQRALRCGARRLMHWLFPWLVAAAASGEGEGSWSAALWRRLLWRRRRRCGGVVGGGGGGNIVLVSN